MGSRSNSRSSSTSNNQAWTDNSNNYSYDDHSSIDNSWSDSSTTNLVNQTTTSVSDNSTTSWSDSSTTNTSSNTTITMIDGGAVDGMASVSSRALDLGEEVTGAAIASAERNAQRVIDANSASSRLLADSVTSTSLKAMESTERSFYKSADAIMASTGDALRASNSAFQSALVFADKKTTSENQQLLEGFQRNALYLAVAGVAIVVLPKVFK